MKKIILLALVLCCVFQSNSINNLWQQFADPSDDSRTKVWWFHGETVTTEEGIDADLESFKNKGVGGVVFYDQIHGNGQGAYPSMSPEWWHMLKYAARKAHRLGLTFEVAVGNGYVTGGPWITKELGMKKTAFTDTIITVNRSHTTVNISLPAPYADFNDIATVIFPDNKALQPVTILSEAITVATVDTAIVWDAGKETEICGISYDLTPRGKGSTGSMNIPGRPSERYFGAGYVEYPPIGKLEYSTDGSTWYEAASLLPVEGTIGHKSKRRTISFPAVKARYYRLHLQDKASKNDKRIKIENVTLYPRDIIDNIEVKTGLRTEVTYPSPCGDNKHAIPLDAIKDVSENVSQDGTLTLKLDKGDWRIIRFGYIPTGARTKHGRKNLLGREADVMSAEAANVHYDNYFKPICDTLACIGLRPDGMCMDSHEAGIQNWTKGFESTFKNSRGYDLIAWLPAFAGYIVDNREKSEGVLRDFRETIAETISKEYYGTFARRCKEDSVNYTSQAMLNIETDNIYNRGNATKPQGEFWAYQTNGNYDCLDAASAAHLYGHDIASGEAFTDTHYSTPWDSLLMIANIAYCRGINEFAVCASSYQPWLDRKYDDSASAHPYIFHRMNPDWQSSGPFWQYQARCTGMLRKGVPVVDLCVYIGEEPPLKIMAYKLPAMPEGYNFDVCTFDALVNRMSATDGKISVKGGMRYKALIVQDRTYISPEAESKLLSLQASGVPVIWCNRGEDVSERLRELAIAPDISITSADMPDDKLLFFHRRTPNADIYFIYNHSSHDIDQQVTLRTTHNRLEAWDPKDVTRDSIGMSNDRRTTLKLAPHQSLFLIAHSDG